MFTIAMTSFREVVLRLLKKGKCKDCGKKCDMEVKKTFCVLKIFFVPVCKFSVNYEMRCTECGHGTIVSKEIGKKLEQDASYNVKYSDLASGQEIERTYERMV